MRSFRPPKDIGAAIAAAKKLPLYARLVWGLLRDGRVPAQQKLILVGIVGYLVMPIDLIPDMIPVLGQLDDLAVALLGLDLFIRSAPRAVVDEHLARISRNEDDLRKDMEQVQRLLGDQFANIRGDLERILARQRSRYHGADEAGDDLGRGRERHRERGSHGEGESS